MEKVKITQVKPNDSNPRYIKEEKFKKLVNSVQQFPEMLQARPIVVNKDMIVLGGNMRLRACQEAGLKEIFVKVVDWSEEKQREFIIKDNVGFGDWDWDVLANEWKNTDLNDWALDVWQPEETDLEGFFQESSSDEEPEKNDPEIWKDLFIKYISEQNKQLYKEASKYADENQ